VFWLVFYLQFLGSNYSLRHNEEIGLIMLLIRMKDGEIELLLFAKLRQQW
jgi:hypothetical protein